MVLRAMERLAAALFHGNVAAMPHGPTQSARCVTEMAGCVRPDKSGRDADPQGTGGRFADRRSVDPVDARQTLDELDPGGNHGNGQHADADATADDLGACMRPEASIMPEMALSSVNQVVTTTMRATASAVITAMSLMMARRSALYEDEVVGAD